MIVRGRHDRRSRGAPTTAGCGGRPAPRRGRSRWRRAPPAPMRCSPSSITAATAFRSSWIRVAARLCAKPATHTGFDMSGLIVAAAEADPESRRHRGRGPDDDAELGARRCDRAGSTTRSRRGRRRPRGARARPTAAVSFVAAGLQTRLSEGTCAPLVRRAARARAARPSCRTARCSSSSGRAAACRCCTSSRSATSPSALTVRTILAATVSGEPTYSAPSLASRSK